MTPSELHAIGLYQRCGEELLTASAENEELRSKVMSHSLGANGSCKDLGLVEQALNERKLVEMFPQITAGRYVLSGGRVSSEFPAETEFLGPGGSGIRTPAANILRSLIGSGCREISACLIRYWRRVMLVNC